MSEHEQQEVAETESIKHERKSTEASEPEEDSFQDAEDTAAAEESTPTMDSIDRPRTRSLTSQLSPVEPIPEDVPELPARGLNGDEKRTEEVVEEEVKQPNSPLLTSHRVSTTSLDNVELDNVSLEEEDSKTEKAESPKGEYMNGAKETADSNIITADGTTSPPALPPKKSPLDGLSGKLPSVPWAPPPKAPQTPASLPVPAPPPTRKLTSPFSWLTRNASTTKEATVPPPVTTTTERRNTASSIATVGSNPEMMLSKLEEGQETEGTNGKGRPARNSLRDRFKLLRMREEAGITELPEEDKATGTFAGLMGRTPTFGMSLGSPTTEDANHPPLSPGPSSPNPALAPGTAAGVSAGPSAMDTAPVDWDLWQTVVDEGPAAVAKTSPEDLNRAITKGIPNAIRGVVWQILAQSQNEGLESMYRDLVNRGTDKDRDRMSGSSGAQSTHSVNGKEEVSSSASSIHSDHSSPATTWASGLRSPSPPKDTDTIAKQQAEKKKKAKEDAASLQKLEKAIRRDLGARTSFSKFAASAGLQEGLFGVCKAYALFDDGVGYAQGMNFLVMPLLFNMPEEEAFCLLVRMMNHYHLRDLFTQDMPGLHMHLYQFERLLEDFEPALYCHLHRRGVTPHLYATQWFLTLFAYRFPLQLVLRIYDLILSEGLSAIIKFGIVLMQKNAQTLLGMTDMMALTNFLKDRLFDVYIDQAPSAGSILESGFFGSSGASIDKEIYRADQLVQDACAIKITPEILKIYTAEWQEKSSLEKERQAELELLKASNHSLTFKVRRLEERVQEHDSEHAALATDLVKTKVENEELKDENESLKIQVKELKSVIDKQPEEIEARLKNEMDRLMKRNQEVHEESSKLEEEMSEMEKTLVETKMKLAEESSQHETLRRKWTDLRRAVEEE